MGLFNCFGRSRRSKKDQGAIPEDAPDGQVTGTAAEKDPADGAQGQGRLQSYSLQYICAWRVVLGGWLLWRDEAVQKFIDRWWVEFTDPDLEDHRLFWDHTSPIEVISGLLVPPALRKDSRRGARGEIQREIVLAVCQSDRYGHCNPAFDWNAARERVEKVLARYGESLPRQPGSSWSDWRDEDTITRLLSTAELNRSLWPDSLG